MLLLNDSQLLCTLPSLHSLTAPESAGGRGSPTAPSVFIMGSIWKGSGKAQNENPVTEDSLCTHPQAAAHLLGCSRTFPSTPYHG